MWAVTNGGSGGGVVLATTRARVAPSTAQARNRDKRNIFVSFFLERIPRVVRRK